MVRKVVYQIIDDLTGEVIKDAQGETVVFGIDGREYEVDLSNRNAAQLRALLEPFIQNARVKGQKNADTSIDDQNAIRSWARANGYSLSAKGRIPTDVVNAYLAAKNADV